MAVRHDNDVQSSDADNDSIRVTKDLPTEQGFINFSEDPFYWSICKIGVLVAFFPLLVWYFIWKRAWRLFRWCLTGKPLFIVARSISAFVKSTAAYLTRPVHHFTKILWNTSSQLVRKLVSKTIGFAYRMMMNGMMQILPYAKQYWKQGISYVKSSVTKAFNKLIASGRFAMTNLISWSGSFTYCFTRLLVIVRRTFIGVVSICKTWARGISSIVSKICKACKQTATRSVRTSIEVGMHILSPVWTAVRRSLNKLTIAAVSKWKDLASFVAARSAAMIRKIKDIARAWVLEYLKSFYVGVIVPSSKYVANSICEKSRAVRDAIKRSASSLWKAIHYSLSILRGVLTPVSKNLGRLARRFCGVFSEALKSSSLFLIHKARHLFTGMHSVCKSISGMIIKQATVVGVKSKRGISVVWKSVIVPAGSVIGRFASNIVSALLQVCKAVVKHARSSLALLYSLILKTVILSRNVCLAIASHFKRFLLSISRRLHSAATNLLTLLRPPIARVLVFVNDIGQRIFRWAKSIGSGIAKGSTVILGKSLRSLRSVWAAILTVSNKSGEVAVKCSQFVGNLACKISSAIISPIRTVLSASRRLMASILRTASMTWNDVIVGSCLMPVARVAGGIVKSTQAKVRASVRSLAAWTSKVCKAIAVMLQARGRRLAVSINMIRQQLLEWFDSLRDMLVSSIGRVQDYGRSIRQQLTLACDSLAAILNRIKRQLTVTANTAMTAMETSREKIQRQATGLKVRLGVTADQLLNKMTRAWA